MPSILASRFGVSWPLGAPRAGFLGLCLLSLAIVLWAYSSNFTAPLVFDDNLLEDPSTYQQYRKLWPLKVRALSYGSFVWLADWGVGWPGQRAFNLLLHLANAVLLGWFYWRLHHWMHKGSGVDTQALSLYAIALASIWFVFNPTAVYGVAYLVQRSILMATFFSLLALHAMIRASYRGLAQDWLWVLVFYAMALLSKEHALALPVALWAVLVMIRRPSKAYLLKTTALFAALGLISAWLIYRYYGHLIGVVFDSNSETFVRQLNQVYPSISQVVWPLSIINQMSLFFEYGWRWFLPDPRTMSVDLRPAFPATWWQPRYLGGVVSYGLVVVAALWLLLRYRDWRSLLGFSLLVPASLYVTEFATVWIQDPFVLYRSYLWAIGVPGVVLAMILVLRLSDKVLLGLAVIVAILFGVLAENRVRSFDSSSELWHDAVLKLPPELTVGQSRAYNNRGEALLQAGKRQLALLDFNQSTRLGDGGEGLLNIGIVAASQGRYEDALTAFKGARQRGMDSPALAFNEAIVFEKIGQPELALRVYRVATQKQGAPAIVAWAHAARASLLIRLRRAQEAEEDLAKALTLAPEAPETLRALALAAMFRDQWAEAIQLYDRLIERQAAEAEDWANRARAKFASGLRAEALSDVWQARKLNPQDANLASLEQIMRGERKSSGEAVPATGPAKP